MDDFKFSLKNITVAALIIVCATLTLRAASAPGKEPVMPKGFKPNAVWRDPFAAPVEITGAHSREALLPNQSENAGGLNPQGQPSLPFTSELPLLAGIVSSGGRQMAIIRHRGISRAYHEGEQVGNYRLVQIGGDAVVLESSAGELTVRLP